MTGWRLLHVGFCEKSVMPNSQADGAPNASSVMVLGRKTLDVKSKSKQTKMIVQEKTCRDPPWRSD